MRVFIDKPRRYPGARGQWSHLWGSRDSIELLHAIAKRIGLKREWFQNRPYFPHYDIRSATKRARAIKLGAVPMSIRMWIKEGKA